MILKSWTVRTNDETLQVELHYDVITKRYRIMEERLELGLRNIIRVRNSQKNERVFKEEIDWVYDTYSRIGKVIEDM